MNYNTLQSLLQNDELHYISDSSQFFIDNQINTKYFKDLNINLNSFTYILFEYTIHDWNNTINTLIDNNIDFTIHTDSYNLDFIII